MQRYRGSLGGTRSPYLEHCSCLARRITSLLVFAFVGSENTTLDDVTSTLMRSRLEALNTPRVWIAPRDHGSEASLSLLIARRD